LQVFVDDETDEGTQGQSHGPDHQQTRTVHSTPGKDKRGHGYEQ
jgi:hypothetical protein